VYWFPFYYTFKFILVLWMALPQTAYVNSRPQATPKAVQLTKTTSGAQVVFNSFLQPVFSRYFTSGSTASNLRATAEKTQ